jgi:hypothetical protein
MSDAADRATRKSDRPSVASKKKRLSIENDQEREEAALKRQKYSQKRGKTAQFSSSSSEEDSEDEPRHYSYNDIHEIETVHLRFSMHRNTRD